MARKYKYKLSVVVLVYNGEKYLKTCLNSLVNQTLDNIEIILVDDASTDDSLSICKKYEQNFENIKIIRKKINKGLGDSGNLGIKIAQGEYVTLVDNDDIIPSYAYEKLYNTAKKNSSDIAIGKPNLFVGIYQYEFMTREKKAWSKERNLYSIEDFPDLLHDPFYWNKIFKRQLILENNIKLPLDKIYADRLFSHKALFYSKKISIINEVVYLWRHRVSDKSLTQKKFDVNNLLDRLDSIEYDLEFFDEEFFSKYSKNLMWRVLIPIQGILHDEKFKKLFFDRSYKILKFVNNKSKNIYDNNLDIIENIYIYMILNRLNNELEKLLNLNLNLERDIICENNKNYWNLPCFKNNNLNIPKELFEIKNLLPQFVNINKIIIDKQTIKFEKILIPENFKVKKGKIIFYGISTSNEKLDDEKVFFEMKREQNSSRQVSNEFSAEISTDHLNRFQRYDVYFQFDYEKEDFDSFRISKYNYKKLINKSKEIKGYLNEDNLSINTIFLNNAFDITIEKNKLKILVCEDVVIKTPMQLYLINKETEEITYLDYNKQYNSFEIELRCFLDEKSLYNVYMEFDSKKFLLNEKFVSKIRTPVFAYKSFEIKLSKSSKKNIILKS